MNLEKSPKSSIDVVGLTAGCMVDSHRVLTALDIQNLRTMETASVKSDHCHAARHLLVVKSTEFFGIECCAHDHYFQWIRRGREALAFEIAWLITRRLDGFQISH